MRQGAGLLSPVDLAPQTLAVKKALFVLCAVGIAVSLTLMAAQRSEHPAVPPPAARAVALTAPARADERPVDRTSAGLITATQLANGARVYRTLCVSCHLPDGKGMFSVIPPLASSDYLLADRERSIRTVLKGVSGPITVNQVAFNGVMPPLEAVLSDQQVADVLTYVFNSWGNEGDAFAASAVGVIRANPPAPEGA